MELEDGIKIAVAVATLVGLLYKGYQTLKNPKRKLLIKVDLDNYGNPETLHLENAGKEPISIQLIYWYSDITDKSEMHPPGEEYFKKYLAIQTMIFPFVISVHAHMPFYNFIHSSFIQLPAIRGGKYFQIKAVDSRNKVWKSPKYPMPQKWRDWAADNQKFIY